MLNVRVQDDLKTYLHTHHHDTISLRVRHNDYITGSINTLTPKIRFKDPTHKDRFDVYEVDGITVYVEKEIEAESDTLEFVDEHVMGIHRCHVKGIRLDSAEIS
jgi:hypothetical protein